MDRKALDAEVQEGRTSDGADEYTTIHNYSRSLIHALVSIHSKEPEDCISEDADVEVNDCAVEQQPAHDREKLFLWQILLHEFLSGPGGNFTGMIPVSELQSPLFETLKPEHTCMHDMFEFVKSLPVSILDGSDMLTSPTSKVSIEGLKSRMDWSLSTADPAQRTERFATICASERHVMKKRVAIDSLAIVMDELREWVCDFDTAIDLFASMEDIVAPHEPEVHEGSHDIPEDAGRKEDTIRDHIHMIQCLDTERRDKKRATSDLMGADLSSSLDLIDGGLQEQCEHLCFVLPLEWIQVMEESLKIVSSLIDWSTIGDEQRESLARYDFSLMDESLPFIQPVGSHSNVPSILEEGRRVCGTILHRGVIELHNKIVPSLRYLKALKPMFERVLMQDPTMGPGHPRVQVVKNTIIAYATLCNGSKQLVCLEKPSWNDLHEALSKLNVSVLQLSWPLHREYFSCNSSRESSWLNFDCFFLSIDKDTLKSVEHNREFLKLFQRVIIFESDPTCLCRMTGMLEEIRRVGVSICFINPDVSDLSLKLCVPEQVTGLLQSAEVSVPRNSCHQNDQFQMIGSDASFDVMDNDHENVDFRFHEIPLHQQTSLGEGSFVRNEVPPAWMAPMASLPQESFFSPALEQQSHKENIHLGYSFPERLDRNFDMNPFDAQQGLTQPGLFENYSGMDVRDSQRNERFQNRRSLEEIDPLAMYGQMHIGYSPEMVGMHPNFQTDASPLHLFSPSPSHCQVRPTLYDDPVHGYMNSPLQIPFTPQRHQSPLVAQGPPCWDSSPTPFTDMNARRHISPVPTQTPRFWSQPMNAVQSFRHIEKMYDDMRAQRPVRRKLRRGEKFRKFT